MSRSIKKNYIYNLLYEIVAIIIPLITTPYVSRVLGATGVGDYGYTAGIVSYFGLLAATGTKNYGQREISIVKDEKYKRSVLFWEIFVFRLVCTIVVLILYSLFVMNFYEQYRLLFIVQLCTVFSYFFDVSWYFQGTENFRITAIRNCLVKILGTILIFLFVKNTEDLWIYTLICSSTVLFGNLTMIPYLLKEISFVKWSDINVIRIIRPIMELFLPVIAIQLYTVFDKTMLGYLCNTTEVGYYEQAEKIIKLALTVLTALIAVLLPRLSFLFSNKDYTQFKLYFRRVIRYLFLISIPMLIGCILISDSFVPVFFGDGYEPVSILLKVESSLFVILSTGQLFGSILIALNKQNKCTLAVFFAALTNVVLNYILIKFLSIGALGAVIASVLAESVSTILQYRYIRKYIDSSVIVRSFIHYLIPGIFMGVVVYVTKMLIGNGILCISISIIAGGLVYFLLLFLTHDEMVFYILNLVKTKTIFRTKP